MAIVLKNKNFSNSTLSGGITNVATSLSVQTGDGAKFPSTGAFRAVIWSAASANPSDDANREIVHVSSVSTDTFTVVRSQEGTTAPVGGWASGAKIAHVLTAGKIDELEAEIAASGASLSTLHAVALSF